jgi:hypothetical protein
MQYGRLLVSIVVLGLVLATGATAQADLCLNIADIFGVPVSLVGKKFKVPPKNQCKPFNGFTTGGFSTFVVGTGCTSADGFAFHLAFTAHNPSAESSFLPSTVTGYCGFILPGLGAGSCRGTEAFANKADDELFGWSSFASGQSCTVNVP